jgi:hypothetical protein
MDDKKLGVGLSKIDLNSLLSPLRSQAGLSLIEIVVAAGLLSVVSLGVSTMMQNSGRAQRSIAMSNDFEQSVQRVAQALNKDVACRSFFASYSNNLAAALPMLPNRPAPIGGYIHQIPTIEYDPDAAGPLPVVQLMRTGPAANGMGVSRIYFLDKLWLGNRPGASGGDMHLVTLRIEGDRKLPATGGNTAAVGGSLIYKDLTVTFLRNGAGAADGCYSNFGTSDFCAQIGGTWNPGTATCDIIQHVCTQQGGTYNAGTGQCDMITAGCIAAGGTPMPPAPALPTYCDMSVVNCTRSGGTPIGVPPAIYCDLVSAQCTAMGGTPIGVGAPGAFCDFRQSLCTNSGGTWSGSTCNYVRRGSCLTPYTIGNMASGSQPDDFFFAYAGGCPTGYFIADLSGHSNRDSTGDRDGFRLQVLCCRNY